jgi:hypothetical protein
VVGTTVSHGCSTSIPVAEKKLICTADNRSRVSRELVRPLAAPLALLYHAFGSVTKSTHMGGSVDSKSGQLYSCRMLTKGCVLALLCVGAVAQTRPNAAGIRRDEMVNLVAAGLSANPENPVTGEQVRIFLTVVNQSENTARAVGVVLFAGKAQVATATLDIAGRHRTIVPLSWNPTAAGPWQLTAVIDPDRHLVEEDRADNVAGLDLVVTGNALKGDAFSVSDLELITQGDHTTIRA